MIWVELHYHEPVGADLLDVTTLRVVRVHDDAVPGPCALGQDVHVEAMEMDGVTVGVGLALISIRDLGRAGPKRKQTELTRQECRSEQ